MADQKNNITGVVLAGGQSIRMGHDKALILWKGRRLVDYLTNTLNAVCSEVLISSHLESHNFPGYQVITDRFSDIGPIAGIEMGLYSAKYSNVLFASVDTPNLSVEFFNYLIAHHQNYDISLAAHGGINEPMIGLFSRRIYSHVLESIQKGIYKPPAIIKETHWQEIDIHAGLNFYHPEMFKNLNRPEDLIH